MDRVETIASMAATIVSGYLARSSGQAEPRSSRQIAEAAVLLAEDIYDLALKNEAGRSGRDEILGAMPAPSSQSGADDGPHTSGPGQDH